MPGPVKVEVPQASQPYDLVFVAVKTTQIADIAPWLEALCGPQTVVCALQNGVEQQSLLAPYLAGGPVLPSVVWFPAQREPDASVWLRSKPRSPCPTSPPLNG
ncbi:2-dehydropantoate 2-reductase [Ewingella americana]|uniref:2-dehydropantoate 2-reductase n=1 Tax=Ewingella americana TaxID=41202 RepID=A0A377NDQ7_9GAMM|nr:2-dehydropantoate 2-reductase [Ewingella americana]